jgi:hypothetical protein
MKIHNSNHLWTLLLVITVITISIGCSAPDSSAVQTAKIPAKPVINAFFADPQQVNPGQAAALQWDVSNAVKVTISPDIGDVPTKYSKQVSPSSTITYILIATNEAGSNSSNVILRVASNNVARPGDITVGVDPVTGRNESFVFLWEQLCLAGYYQLQIAKNPTFTLLVFDSGVFAPNDESVTSPALVYQLSNLEAGHTYYYRFRVRGAVTGQMIRGPWSETGVITNKAGNSVSTGYSGVQLLNPGNGCSGCPIQPVSFSWSPYSQTTKYRLTLARDAGLTDIIRKVDVPTTSYQYDGRLDYDTMYFWQVTGLEPAPSDPSAVFSFVTESKPKSIAAIAIPTPTTPLWVWIVIGVGMLLIIATVVVIFRARNITI